MLGGSDWVPDCLDIEGAAVLVSCRSDELAALGRACGERQHTGVLLSLTQAGIRISQLVLQPNPSVVNINSCFFQYANFDLWTYRLVKHHPRLTKLSHRFPKFTCQVWVYILVVIQTCPTLSGIPQERGGVLCKQGCHLQCKNDRGEENYCSCRFRLSKMRLATSWVWSWQAHLLENRLVGIRLMFTLIYQGQRLS